MNNNEVVLDFGHGGTDSGAVAGSYLEKVWNKDTGESCKSELERHNVKVHLTRKADETISLNKRCEIANNTNAKWFVSIHHNAGGGDRGETIHSITHGEGKELADKIGKELKSIGQTAIKTYSRSSSNNKDYYAVIRGTKMKAVIVEVCFMDNTADRQIADTLEERKRNGIAIAHGILKQMGVAIKDDSQSGSYLVKINEDSLNVRSGPGTNYKINTTVKKGDVFTIVETQDHWGKLKSGAGYISILDAYVTRL